MRPTLFALAIAGLLTAGCDLDVPDLNNPGIDEVENDPSRASVNAATTGLLIGSRANYAQANGYVAQLGILGREAYNFDNADPRFTGELLAGDLNPGSPFGGNFWATPYANIRAVHIVLGAVDRVPEYSDAERAGIRGFAQTIRVLDLLEVITTRDSNGAVIDTDKPISELGAIVGVDEALAFVAELLDDAATDLEAAGDDFAFPLSSGFDGFATPPTFLRFNRALRARVAAYQGDYATVQTALADSFLDDAATTVAELETGVYYSYSTGAGDQVNNLINPNIYAHPSVKTDAQATDDDGPDYRYARKVTEAETPGQSEGRSSSLQFTIYDGPGAPVPIIRNEELILLRAEAHWADGDLDEAIADLDLIRSVSGGLESLDPGLEGDEVEDELLYNRRYSLLFEGGHRWIDLRRFDRIEDLPLDLPDDERNVRYPIPLPECNARPGEPACDLGSN